MIYQLSDRVYQCKVGGAIGPAEREIGGIRPVPSFRCCSSNRSLTSRRCSTCRTQFLHLSHQRGVSLGLSPHRWSKVESTYLHGFQSQWCVVHLVSTETAKVKRNDPLDRCHDGSPRYTPRSTSPTACVCIYTQENRIIFNGDLCAACEASADSRRPFNHTAPSGCIGPNACISEGN